MSQVKAIYARAINGVMGNANSLPWDVPADLKRFKRLTLGCIVVMGYNTWKSLGERPLPNRVNVVICRKGTHVVGANTAATLEQAVNYWRADPRTIWVIGGPALVAQATTDYDAEVHRTTLNLEPKGDTSSAAPDRCLIDYHRVGYEEFKCSESNVDVVFERFVKAGIDAGLR
ncbi:hypothetical protein ATN89_17135 [Comamonas thiooxydans]|uniref:dihydrofolate reductase n=1 Tax=Comamonas thiooxydans TaxID=363952 RepID=UPI0007C4539D|nr:dihydrofolate reductase [Comamonas thiooxydans]OAD82942.1 hypothetical protein ATN89_17135 [Comamonas thiooxydans]